MNNKKNKRKRSVKLDPILLRFMAISWHLPSSKKSKSSSHCFGKSAQGLKKDEEREIG